MYTLYADCSFNDLYRLSVAANTWTALSPSGSGPSPRFAMGFAATPDGMLYVFGGEDSRGRDNEGGRGGSLYAISICLYIMQIYLMKHYTL
jgi:hypothetical protein